jgi:5-methylcytosine-specific restriction protein A
MPRKARTTLQREKIFLDAGGICHICGCKIDGTREAWDLEHVIPYSLTRDDSDENLRPAHVKCHKDKTREDKGVIAKCKRVAAKHNGARSAKAKLPGSRGSGWKQKLNGEWVKR